jgi:hypothetical protein
LSINPTAPDEEKDDIEPENDESSKADEPANSSMVDMFEDDE